MTHSPAWLATRVSSGVAVSVIVARASFEILRISDGVLIPSRREMLARKYCVFSFIYQADSAS
jgi:hypothetical protein